MDNGASSYRCFLDGDDNGIIEIIRDYKDGLMLFLNRYVNNIHVAEELAEETFVRLGGKEDAMGLFPRAMSQVNKVDFVPVLARA